MTNFLQGLGFVIAGIVVGLSFSAFNSGFFGGVYNQVNNTFREGIKVGTSDQYSIDSSGVLTSTGNATVGATAGGGILTIPTANTATSSIKVGCVQMNATSTATIIHLEFNTTSSTSTINGAAAGLVAWRYGACPV